MDSKNVILVCTHKNADLNLPDIYKPIIGGADINKLENQSWLKDNEGKDNISWKNPYYSELTTLYWGWKHLNFDNLGLVHYRRYFKGKDKAIINGKKINVLSNDEINKYLSKYDVIVPKKRHYVIESLYSHYCRTLRKEPIDALEKIIKIKYPEYIDEFNNLKKRRSAHMFNMIIGTKRFFDKYLQVLFDILKNIEPLVNSSNWGTYEKRYIGFLSELVLDMYIRKNNIKFKEIKVAQLIPFGNLKKGFKYLKSYLFKIKYRGSDI